ncbi:hypothetical protein C1A50_5272 [Paenibacillus polymyxa]|nr:hypothetical protein C1A50_5272 [Paenibacillus polymyxa]
MVGIWRIEMIHWGHAKPKPFYVSTIFKGAMRGMYYFKWLDMV